jgi:Ca2+-binding EF-hand superfamily protein
VVFDHFDANKDGNIAYSEFVNVLKDDMTDGRIAIVKRAWQQLSGGAGEVPFEELVAKFNAPAHPRVTSREKKAETVMSDFVTLMGEKAPQGTVSEESFISYYSDCNAVLPADRESYFIDVILKTWGLTGGAEAVSGGRVQEIEDVIFEKIRQRTHGADDEGKTMRKVFKHFDLDGFGTIDFGEFKKALETIGCLFKDFEMRAVFDKFDKDGNNKLDYEEFSNGFAIRGSGNNPNVNPVFGVKREPPNQVLDKVLGELKRRGANGIRGLGIVFRRMDNNGDKKMDRHEFMWGLRENGHSLTPSEFERIFKYFDKNNDGKISYDEFLRGIRGDLNAFRKGFVMQAYAKLDRTGDGIVDMNDMLAIYDVSFHPKFKTGEMSKADVLNEFMAQWDTVEKDGKITKEEFIDYYTDVSASIDEDDYFELMIRNAWHIAGGEGQSANTTIPRHLVTDAQGNQSVQMMAGAENFSYDKNASNFWGGDI